MGSSSCESNLPLEPSLVYCDDEEQTFWSLSEPHKMYRKRIAALCGDSMIAAHSSGWFLLTDQGEEEEEDAQLFSLWNPTISDSFIHLPPLSLNPTPNIKYYFLSSPPGDPDCKVLLVDDVLGSIIFIRPDSPHQEWTQIQYPKSVVADSEGAEETRECLHRCVSCNGKLYGFTFQGRELVSLDVDKADNLVIEPLGKMPDAVPSTGGAIIASILHRLVECCGQLLYVYVVFGGSKVDQLTEVQVFTFDFVPMVWKTAQSLMGQAVFLDAVGASSFNPTFGKGIEADSIYFADIEDPGLLYSFNVKDGCLSITLPCPTVPSSSSFSPFIFVPPDVWLSRATCRSIPKLQHTPGLQMWLMHSINDMTAFKFFDPIHGTSFIMNVPESLKGCVLRHSRNGWLLLSDGDFSMSFLNPFTEEIIKLPKTPIEDCARSYAMSFSSLPTSPDCIVIGCGGFPPTDTSSGLRISVITMGGPNEWIERYTEHDTMFWLNNTSPVFYKGSFYLLDLEGTLSVLNHRIVSWEILREPRIPCTSFRQNFLLECDGKLMSIFVGQMGEWLQVYSLDFNTMRWENVESLGNYVIYVSQSSSTAIKASIMGINNRIYFPRFRDNCILYYSLETRKFHLDSQGTLKNFYNTRELLLATWIELSCS